MVNTMKEIVEYLKDNYQACVDLCGEEDDVNTIPAKQAYKKALKVYTEMQKTEVAS